MNRNIIPRNRITKLVRRLQRAGKRVVFTNGVFDIIHRGHVEYLSKARAAGDVLIVGVNTDKSVRRLKGKQRPYQSQRDRAIILLALRSVDYVVFFGEDRPDKLIEQVRPDVLVKAEFVKSCGGQVKRIKLTPGRSSSKIIRFLK